jgi:hypothetical protein
VTRKALELTAYHRLGRANTTHNSLTIYTTTTNCPEEAILEGESNKR